MAKGRELGMCTFDQALFDLYMAGHITYDEAIRNADSANELRLQIKLKSGAGSEDKGGLNLAIEEEPEEEEEGKEGEKKA
jgi:twitching motility protein PilU